METNSCCSFNFDFLQFGFAAHVNFSQLSFKVSLAFCIPLLLFHPRVSLELGQLHDIRLATHYVVSLFARSCLVAINQWR